MQLRPAPLALFCALKLFLSEDFRADPRETGFQCVGVPAAAAPNLYLVPAASAPAAR